MSTRFRPIPPSGGLLLCLILLGCRSGVDAPTAPPLPSASLSLVLAPEPLLATPSGDPEAPLRVDWVLAITARGAGGTIGLVNATVRDLDAGGLPEPARTIILAATDVAALAGTSRITDGGTLRVEQGLSYAVPTDGRRATLVVTVQLADDLGNLVSRSVTTPVE